jgi:hypothetical protein
LPGNGGWGNVKTKLWEMADMVKVLEDWEAEQISATA